MHTEKPIALEEPLIIFLSSGLKTPIFVYLLSHHDKVSLRKNILKKLKQYLIKNVWAIPQPRLKYKIRVLFLS